MARWLLILTIVTALASTATASVPTAVDPWEQAQSLLDPGTSVRDLVEFTTENGETASLVLGVAGVEKLSGVASDDEGIAEYTCQNEIEGIGITGYYSLSLIMKGNLINTVQIPGLGREDSRITLPSRNRAAFNWSCWGQGKKLSSTSLEGSKIETSKILRLSDYTGDGRKYETRILSYLGPCGHAMMLLAGYSAVQRRVMIYPVIDGEDSRYWSDNLFGHPSEKHKATVTSVYDCGDHGNPVRREDVYKIDTKKEAWVKIKSIEKSCPEFEWHEWDQVYADCIQQAAQPISKADEKACGKKKAEAKKRIEIEKRREDEMEKRAASEEAARQRKEAERERLLERLEHASLAERERAAIQLCSRAIPIVRMNQRLVISGVEVSERMQAQMEEASADYQIAEGLFRGIAEQMAERGASGAERRRLQSSFSRACTP